MRHSLKQLIERTPEKSSGIFTFRQHPELIIADTNGKKVSNYLDLDELVIGQEEKEFVQRRWDEIKREHPHFYDGDVTAIVDVIHDDENDSLTFITQRTKYSVISAMRGDDYPNKERAKEFLSFGLGLMSNLSIEQEGSFLMLERSQKVHSEKGAISVPGGTMEYKEGGKDDVHRGLKAAAKSEVIEEVLSDDYENSEFNIKTIAVGYTKSADGVVGLSLNFDLTPKQAITRQDVRESFKKAQDGTYESTGEFFFVDPERQYGISTVKDTLYPLPSDIIESGKLQFSGSAALAAEVYQRMLQSYDKGLYAGLLPHTDGIADKFTNIENFNIFDLAHICNSKISRPLTSPEDTRVEKVLSRDAENEI